MYVYITPPDYEIFCYIRWFILRNFMRMYGFSKVFYIDSDVLFFENAETEWAKFDQYDMTLLEYFHYHSEFGGGPGRVGEMMQIINDTTYDHNINVSDQDFEMQNGVKHIKIIDEQPYIYSKKLKKDIKFNALHFQGPSKNLMKKIYEQCN